MAAVGERRWRSRQGEHRAPQQERRPPSNVVADELNFCVRDGREPDRRRGRIKGGRSECRGRQDTNLLRLAKFLPGTTNGNRWTLIAINTNYIIKTSPLS